jgi:hypothetical protein
LGLTVTLTGQTYRNCQGSRRLCAVVQYALQPCSALFFGAQVGAARLLGVNEATSRRWAAHGVSGTAAILLWLISPTRHARRCDTNGCDTCL